LSNHQESHTGVGVFITAPSCVTCRLRRTVLDRDVVRKALPTHQLTTNSCEHQTHTCSHCSMTMFGRQVAVIRLCNQILHAAALEFAFRLASGSSTPLPDRNHMEIRPCAGRLFCIKLLQDSSRRYHKIRRPVDEEEPHTGRWWVQSGINYATEYVHLFNANLVSCMLPPHSRPSIH